MHKTPTTRGLNDARQRLAANDLGSINDMTSGRTVFFLDACVSEVNPVPCLEICNFSDFASSGKHLSVKTSCPTNAVDHAKESVGTTSAVFCDAGIDRAGSRAHACPETDIGISLNAVRGLVVDAHFAADTDM